MNKQITHYNDLFLALDNSVNLRIYLILCTFVYSLHKMYVSYLNAHVCLLLQIMSHVLPFI